MSWNDRRGEQSVLENPRLELFIAKHGRRLLIALVVVGVLAVAATGWVVATPSTTTTTQQVDAETVSTETTTSAVVVEDGLWTDGTELEDSSVYMLSSTPELTLTPQTSVPTAESTVVHEVAVRHEASRDDTVFWDDVDHQSRTDANVSEGVGTSETTINATAIADRQREIESEVSGVGDVQTTIELTVEYDTGTYTDEQELVAPIQVTNEAYWLEESLDESTDHSQTAQVEVQESPNATAIGGLLALAVLSFGGAVFVRNREQIDVAAARRAVHQNRYAEWISRGSLPMWVGDYHIGLDTLEDVVDVAIDTNERVVHDTQRDLFAVVNGNVVYYYSDQGQWEGTAWPVLNLGDGSSSSAGPSGSLESSVDSAPPLEFDDDLPDPDADDAWEQI